MEVWTARERLVAGALERVSGLSAREAAAWIDSHGLLSLVRDSRLDGAVRDLLMPRVREVAAQNLAHVDLFRRLVDTFQGIPVCPLKGIHLLDTVYRDDPESRPMLDLDLLVPADAIDEAVAGAGSLGFREIGVSHRIRGVAPARVLTSGAAVVELHTRLGIKHGWPSAWDQVAPRPGRVHGREVFVLDAETLLVHLVIHVVKHRPFSRLVWVEDVLRWIEQSGGGGSEGSIDGARVVARARELGAFRSLVAGVRILRRTLGPVGLPEVPDAPSRPADRAAVRLNERLVWRDLLGDPWGAGESTAPGRALSALLLADRVADAGRFLRAKAMEVRRR